MRSAGAPMRRASSSVEISAADCAMSLSLGWERKTKTPSGLRPPPLFAPQKALRWGRVGAGAGAAEEAAGGASWPTSGCVAAVVVFLVFFFVVVGAALGVAWA